MRDVRVLLHAVGGLPLPFLQGVGRAGMNWTSNQTTATGFKLIGVPICPDLLSFADLGEADNLRGRFVRAFFWLLRIWRTP